MLDISVIILTFNEKLHIKRSLENAALFAKKIYVVDCFSTDGTKQIAREMGAVVVEHQWPGNQAVQFNWALDNLPIDTEWVLRLDADEYLTPELIDELNQILPTMAAEYSALVFPLGRAFMGRILKHGIVNGVSMIRMFRFGKARYEARLMDEHFEVSDGKTYMCKHKFVDDNKIPLSQFISKHNAYSNREAALLLDEEYHLSGSDSQDVATSGFAESVKAKRSQKNRYARFPLFWRAFGYFGYRYFIKLGFLDGKEGFLWDFLQGWWYRTLVDAKILEVKRACGNDKEKIRAYLKSQYGISL